MKIRMVTAPQKTPFHFSLIFFLLSFTAFTATWIPTNGPEGGEVLFLQKSQNRFYASTLNGLYFSENPENDGWTEMQCPLLNNDVFSTFTVSGDTLIAGTFFSGLLCSIDEGISWYRMFPEPIENIDSSIRVSMISAVLFTGSTIVFSNSFNNIFYSDDFGQTWTMNRYHFKADRFLIHENAFFALSRSSGILRSLDNGQTWVSVSSGLGANIPCDLCSYGATLFAATHPDGIQLSTDTGITWSTHTAGIEKEYPEKHITRVVSNDSDMYAFVISGGRSTHAALFHYRNSNQKWVETGTVPNPHSLHSVVVCDDFLWIGSSKGILHYSVKQASWDFFPSGLHAQSITGLAGKSIGVFATSYHGQFFQYNEITKTWDNIFHENNNFFSMSNNEDEILLSGYGAVYYSVDGYSFDTIPISIPHTNKPVYCSVVHNDYVFALAGGTLSRRKIGSGLWETVRSDCPDTKGFYYMYSDSNRIYTLFAGHFKYSMNNGETWIDVFPNDDILCMSLHDSLVFVSSKGNGVYVSENKGISWNHPFSLQSNIHVLETEGFYTFAATSDGDVLVSFDSTRTWQSILGNLRGKNGITCLEIVDTVLFAGTSGSSIWILNLNTIYPNNVSPEWKKVSYWHRKSFSNFTTQFNIAGQLIKKNRHNQLRISENASGMYLFKGDSRKSTTGLCDGHISIMKDK